MFIGGKIFATPETMPKLDGTIYLFGSIPLRSIESNPTSMINNDKKSYNFIGTNGTIIIELAESIEIEEIQLTGKIESKSNKNSAPQIIEISGSDDGKYFEKLTSFQYKKNGEPTQTITLKNKAVTEVKFVKFDIKSNWGNLKYTRIYSIKIFGQ